MFDAKSLLDGLLGGQQSQTGAQGGQGAAQLGGLGAVLGNLLNQVQTQAQQSGLGNVMDQVRQQGVGGVAGNVFGQATGGLRDVAGRVDEQTGASARLNDIVGQLSGGKSPADIIAQVREMAQNNPGAATAALGGLAAAIFGTSTGRGLAVNAAKLGGLALIGGLAYRAWQNHQQGKPLLDLNQPAQLAPPPAGSGFEAEAASNETAILYIRAMIAAAAADGSVDATERATILAGVKQAGFHAEANAWIENEIANPASVDDLVAGAKSSQELAAQVYTAARISIDPDSRQESHFLQELASGLELPEELVAQIDAAATTARAAA